MIAWVSVPRHVEHRRTVDVDAGGAELVGDQPVAQAHRRDAPRPVREPPAFVERRQPLAPRRPAQAGDAAALLVDQHRGVAAHRVAQVGGQPRELGRVRDVAREQDEPHGSAPAKNRRSSGESTGPAAPKMTARAAIYCKVTGMQSTPRARSASHISRVWSVLEKPATRRR